MDKIKYNVVYLDGTEKYKHDYMLLAWIDDRKTGKGASYNNYYNLADKRLTHGFYEDKWSIDYIVSNFMKLLIEKQEKACFYITISHNKEMSKFEYNFYKGLVFDSGLDYIEFKNEQHKKRNKDIYHLPNILGLYFDGASLYIVSKKTFLNLKDKAPICIHSSLETYFNTIIGREKPMYQIISYHYENNFWFITAGQFKFALDKDEEPYPFITFYQGYSRSEKVDKIELVTWLQDDIISKIPNASINFISNCRACKLLSNNKRSMADIEAYFDNLYEDDNWTTIESTNYTAKYSLDNFLVFKVIKKNTGKAVCLVYH